MNLESFEPQCVEEVLLAHGAQSVTLTDAADDPVLEPAPGETPLWRDTRITALFDAATDFDALRTALGEALETGTLPANRVEDLADRAWEREWLRDFGPMQFGRRLWVAPEQASVTDSDAVVVRLDPGLAFGTGTHATTALCLEWLDAAELDGRTVLDFGCGSGILAVAAAKLGAARILAVDNDPQALTATAENARRNGVASHIDVAPALDEKSGPFDFVVANILAGTLRDHARALTDALRPGGELALSGILEPQADDVATAFEPHIEWQAPRHRDGWTCLAGNR